MRSRTGCRPAPPVSGAVDPRDPAWEAVGDAAPPIRPESGPDGTTWTEDAVTAVGEATLVIDDGEVIEARNAALRARCGGAGGAVSVPGATWR